MWYTLLERSTKKRIIGDVSYSFLQNLRVCQSYVKLLIDIAHNCTAVVTQDCTVDVAQDCTLYVAQECTVLSFYLYCYPHCDVPGKLIAILPFHRPPLLHIFPQPTHARQISLLLLLAAPTMSSPYNWSLFLTLFSMEFQASLYFFCFMSSEFAL